MRNGVPRGETTVTTVACAGTLLLEFGVLSELTDDPTYIVRASCAPPRHTTQLLTPLSTSAQIVAEAAMEAVWDLRSERNLLGTHVDAQSGKWVAPVCHMWMCGLNRSTASPPLITLSAPPSDPPHPPPASLHTPALYARTALGIDDRRRRRQLFRVPLEGHGPVQRHLLRRHLCGGVHGRREHASSGALVRPRR